MPSSGNTATKAELAKIKKMYDAGASRNEIAKALGKSWQWTTATCRVHGWGFDRSQSKAAAEASVFDSKARLAKLAERSIALAETTVARLEAEQYTYTIAVAGKGAVSITDSAPPAQDMRNLTVSVQTLITQATRLLDRNDDGGIRAQKSMIEKLSESLGIKDV